MNKISLYIFTLVILLFVLFGCDKIDCRPDARAENDKGDWYAGIVCGGDFNK